MSETAKDSRSDEINPDKNDAAADSKDSSESLALSVLYSCPFCDKSYDKGQSLQKHTRTRHNKTVVYCTLCAAVFRFVPVVELWSNNGQSSKSSDSFQSPT